MSLYKSRAAHKLTNSSNLDTGHLIPVSSVKTDVAPDMKRWRSFRYKKGDAATNIKGWRSLSYEDGWLCPCLRVPSLRAMVMKGDYFWGIEWVLCRFLYGNGRVWKDDLCVDDLYVEDLCVDDLCEYDLCVEDLCMANWCVNYLCGDDLYVDDLIVCEWMIEVCC